MSEYMEQFAVWTFPALKLYIHFVVPVPGIMYGKIC
jgi:hypothetical protein